MLAGELPVLHRRCAGHGAVGAVYGTVDAAVRERPRQEDVPQDTARRHRCTDRHWCKRRHVVLSYGTQPCEPHVWLER